MAEASHPRTTHPFRAQAGHSTITVSDDVEVDPEPLILQVELEAARESQQAAPPADPIPADPISLGLADSDMPSVSASGMTLEAFEAIAIQHNPAIVEASASAHKAMGYRDQVVRSPNPVVGYNATQLVDAGTDQHTIFVEQDFVTAGKLGRNAAVLDHEIQSQLWEVEAQRYRVLTDVRSTFFEALAAQNTLTLALEFEDLANKGVQYAQARLSALEGSRPEVLQAEIQYQQVQVQRAQAEANFHAAWTKLTAVAGVPDLPHTHLDGAFPEAPSARDWDVLYSQILDSSPERRAAQSRLCRAQANLDRQQAQAIPNVSFYLGAGADNGTDTSLINAQVGLPLPLHNRNQGNISAAQAEVCRASQEIARIEMSLKSRLAEAGRNYDSAAFTVHRHAAEILPKARENLSLTEAAYQGGQFDFLQVYTARKTFFEANLAYIDAQLKLALASAQVDGQLLSGGLEPTRDTEFDSGLRDQALSGQ